ncbi:MAG: SBBP repeat-containing protein [Candidatus Schekmanbacteria bacterium]|nr:SBBP repeat-containing protein [Candidatus Schekmanbacteria bacterium]
MSRKLTFLWGNPVLVVNLAVSGSRSRGILVGSVVLTSLLIAATAWAVVPPPGQAATAGALSVATGFEANVGQAAAEAVFLGRGRDYQVSFGAAGSLLTVRDPRSGRSATVRLEFRDASPMSAPQGVDPLRGEVSYYRGGDPRRWLRGIPTFRAVAYPELYAGTDVIFYDAAGVLELDVVLAPGADPTTPLFAFSGAEKLAIDERGDLHVTVLGRDIIQRAPRAYQIDGPTGGRAPVTSSYVLVGDGLVRFQVDAYDVTRMLVIDPLIDYSTFIGGNSDDRGQSVVTDSDGHVYIACTTFSDAEFPVLNSLGAPFGANAGITDAAIVKLDPNAAPGSQLLFAAYFGGSEVDDATDIALDPSTGDIVLVGITDSFDFPTRNAYQSTNAAPSDIFVVKLLGDGSDILYSTYLGGDSSESPDTPAAVAVTSTGLAVVVGYTFSTDFPQQFPTQPGLLGFTDGFVTALLADGSGLAFSTYLGGTGEDSLRGVAVDAQDKAYVAGLSDSSDFPVSDDAYQPLDSGSADAVFARFNLSTHVLEYATYLGGSATDWGNDIAVTPTGEAWIGGLTGSGSSFPMVNPLQSPAATPDAFLTKFSADGRSLAFSTLLGGSSYDEINGLSLDAAGNVYFTGTTDSAALPVANAFQPDPASMVDAFVGRVRSGGEYLDDLSFLGGGSDDAGNAIFAGDDGVRYVVGTTFAADFPVTSSTAYDDTLTAPTDAFVTRIGSHGIAMPGVGQLAAVPGDNRVVLTWTTLDVPSGVVYGVADVVHITRGTSGFPVTPGDGASIGPIGSNSVADTGAVNGTTYYYSAFVTSNPSLVVASPGGFAMATPMAGLADAGKPFFVSGPFVEDARSGQIAMSFDASEPVLATLKWRDSGGAASGQVSSAGYGTHANLTATGLTAGLTYLVQGCMVDYADSGEVCSVEQSVAMPAAFARAVAAPRLVEPPAPAAVSDRAVTLFWETNVPTTAAVEYGETADYSSSTYVGDYTTHHQLELGGLNPNTTYQFAVSGASLDGQSFATYTYTFMTQSAPDTLMPDLLSIVCDSRSVTQGSALVEVHTNEATTLVLDYAVAGSPAGSVASAELRTLHRLLVPGLTSDTEYTFTATVTDRWGRIGTSASDACRTLASAPSAALRILEGPLAGAERSTTDLIVVDWITDWPADSEVLWEAVTARAGEVEAAPRRDLPANSVYDPELTRDHRVYVTGLTPDTRYRIVVRSRDIFGRDPVESEEIEARTWPTGGIPPAMYTNEGTIEYAADGTAVIRWALNRLAKSELAYREVEEGGRSLLPSLQEGAHALLAPLAGGGRVGGGKDDRTEHAPSFRPFPREREDDGRARQIVKWIVVFSSPRAEKEEVAEIPDLDPAKQYEFRLRSWTLDGAFLEATPPVSTFLPTSDDTTPPEVRDLVVASTTNTAVVLEWTTSEPAVSTVVFSTGDGHEEHVQEDSPAVDHSIRISDLPTAGVVTYHVDAQDPTGNVGSSTPAQTTTAATKDVTAPHLVGSPTVRVESPFVILVWDTDEAADTVVRFGQSPANLDRYVQAGADVTHHEMALSELVSGTAYYAEVYSVDLEGNPSEKVLLGPFSLPVPAETVAATTCLLAGLSVLASRAGRRRRR